MARSAREIRLRHPGLGFRESSVAERTTRSRWPPAAWSKARPLEAFDRSCSRACRCSGSRRGGDEDWVKKPHSESHLALLSDSCPTAGDQRLRPRLRTTLTLLPSGSCLPACGVWETTRPLTTLREYVRFTWPSVQCDFASRTRAVRSVANLSFGTTHGNAPM